MSFAGSIRQKMAAARDIPILARVLGYAAVAPFIAAPMLVYAERSSLGSPARGIAVYSAVILSFIAGIRWGQALFATNDEDRRDRIFLWSIVPPLIGWDAVFMPKGAAFFVLALAMAIQGICDVSDTGRNRFPMWFGILRLQMTVVATGGLFIAAMVVWS